MQWNPWRSYKLNSVCSVLLCLMFTYSYYWCRSTPHLVCLRNCMRRLVFSLMHLSHINRKRQNNKHITTKYAIEGNATKMQQFSLYRCSLNSRIRMLFDTRYFGYTLTSLYMFSKTVRQMPTLITCRLNKIS